MHTNCRSCNKDYVDKCARRLCGSVKYHNGHYHSPPLVKLVGNTSHLPVESSNFEVTGSGHGNNARRRKIAKALLVKKLKPTLNIQ